MKGYRTLLFAVALAIGGVLQIFDWASIIPQNQTWSGAAMLGVGAAVAALRYVTTSPDDEIVMAVIAVVLGLLLGASGPIALGALSTFQIAQLAIMGVKVGHDVLKINGKLLSKINPQAFQTIDSPSFRAWVAANGEAAIRLQPGLIKER